MCLAIPALIKTIEGYLAEVEVGGAEQLHGHRSGPSERVAEQFASGIRRGQAERSHPGRPALKETVDERALWGVDPTPGPSPRRGGE
jgi:hypothetical protein